MQDGGACRKATGLRLFWYTMWARAYPRMIGATRERSWLFFETLLPVLGVAGYVFIYRAIEAPPEYAGFAVLGGAMTAFWLNVLWSHGQPALLGQGPGQPGAVRRSARRR